ncbi:MAG: bacillithiol biosynthesis deacetylase BshB1 [Chitinophagales bacterium]|nr:bacillithiol biosynthesis deacetylase BshB1 [Chitinophagales bacterium]
MQSTKVNILAIGAHPDDVELSCSGTILAHIAQGYTAAIVDLTHGELGTRGDATTRLAEAKSAAAILGVAHRINLGFKDGFFQNDEWHQRELIKAIRHFQPDIVLANAVYDRHPDHGRAAQLIRDAAFLAGLPKVQTQWEGEEQVAHRPKALYHYIQSLDAKADFAVDISAYMDKKMESIYAYASQFFDPNSTEKNTFISSPEFLEFVKARASNFGVPIGVRYAEGFTANKLIGVNNLFSLI